MIEQERKFLLKDESALEGLSSSLIEQGYLMLGKTQQVRIRIVNDLKAFICYKKDISEGKRYEYEFDIDIEEARILYGSCKYKLEKLRYFVPVLGPNGFAKYYADVDVYPNGLRVVEIEFEGELKEIPEFCGREVTGQKEYSNIYLAKLLTKS